MQKIGQLQSYVEVLETQVPTFLHPVGQEDQSRLIKMRIRAAQATNLYVQPIDLESGEVGDDIFLAHIEPGLDQIEFYYVGSFGLRLMGGNVWLDTYDNTAFNIESADPTSFARLWEREERDPRILEIERSARHNSMLLQQQMEADRAAFRQEMAAMRQEAQNHVTPAQSPAPAPTGSQQAQSPASAPTGDNRTPAATAGTNGGEPQANA